MQSIAVGRHRRNTAVIGIAALALIVALAGGAAVMLSTGEQASLSRPVAPDPTTLVLDRDGADIVAPASQPPAVDTTGLNLDRDGADVFPEHTSAAPDVTTLRLDRDGADIP